MDGASDLVSVGSTAATTSAKFAVTSTSKGFLTPRLTTAQKNSIASPAAGLEVFDTDYGRKFLYDGVSWSLIESYKITGVTANYTINKTDYTVNCRTNSFTVTLPTAVGISGKTFNIKVTDNISVTAATTSSQTIDGYGSGVIVLSQYDSLQVQSDGSNWVVI